MKDWNGLEIIEANIYEVCENGKDKPKFIGTGITKRDRSLEWMAKRRRLTLFELLNKEI